MPIAKFKNHKWAYWAVSQGIPLDTQRNLSVCIQISYQQAKRRPGCWLTSSPTSFGQPVHLRCPCCGSCCKQLLLILPLVLPLLTPLPCLSVLSISIGIVLPPCWKPFSDSHPDHEVRLHSYCEEKCGIKSLSTYSKITLGEYPVLQEKGAPRAIPSMCVLTIKKDGNLLPLQEKCCIIILTKIKSCLLGEIHA